MPTQSVYDTTWAARRLLRYIIDYAIRFWFLVVWVVGAVRLTSLQAVLAVVAGSASAFLVLSQFSCVLDPRQYPQREGWLTCAFLSDLWGCE